MAGVLIAITLTPLASADPDPTIPPPANLEGICDSDGTITLTWDAPPTEAAWTYKVYRNGEALGTTSATTYEDAKENDVRIVYTVTTRASNGDESVPMAYVTSCDGSLPSPSCELISITTTTTPPFVHVNIHDECL